MTGCANSFFCAKNVLMTHVLISFHDHVFSPYLYHRRERELVKLKLGIVISASSRRQRSSIQLSEQRASHIPLPSWYSPSVYCANLQTLLHHTNTIAKIHTGHIIAQNLRASTSTDNQSSPYPSTPSTWHVQLLQLSQD